MRISLIGYGRMGRTIESLAREQGHSIIHVMDIAENPMQEGFSGKWVGETDVMIDFFPGGGGSPEHSKRGPVGYPDR